MHMLKNIQSLNRVIVTEFTIGGAYLGHRITGKTIQADTSILIGNTTYNNVIVTIHFDYYCISSIGGSPEDCATLKEYYAKNIGLIKREKRNYPIDTLFFTEIEISEYGLNK